MNVNKRIGKLKQWTGEKLGGQQKTELSEDFQSLQQDVELRKVGIEKMYSVSKEFSKHLTRKIEAEGTDTGKTIPIDALGSVLMNHGEEFGSDNIFGEALMSFGKAQQQIATSTANFTDYLNSGWLTSLEKSIAQMAEYTNQRKKLDSRRLTYDAMLAKVQKSKKEKRDLEDDLRVAKNRYEETSEEVQERAIAIQDSEADQMIALTRLLEIESDWVDEQKKILDDLKRNWPDPSAFKNNNLGNTRKKPTAHTFGQEPSPPSKTTIKSKTGSVSRRTRNHYLEEGDEDDCQAREDEQDEVEDEEREQELGPRRQPRPAVTAPVKTRPTPSRRESLIKEKSSVNNNSNGRYGGVRIPGMPPPGASSTHSDESASPPIDNEYRRSNGPLKHSSSNVNLKRPPVVPSNKKVKWMTARWAYSAVEADELELEIGDRVKVTNEINPEWFVGRNKSTGRTGMFPAAYCVLEQPEPGTKYLIPETSDTFADPDDHYADDGTGLDEGQDDEDEGAALRPALAPPATNQTSRSFGKHPSRTGSYTGKLPPVSATAPGHPNTVKRAPPPPPSRRVTSTSTKPAPSTPSYESEDQPEAFGSVSELKKRLGISK